MPRIEVSSEIKDRLQEIRSLLEIKLKKIIDMPEALNWLLEHSDVEKIIENLKEPKHRTFYKLVIIGDAAVGKTAVARKIGMSHLKGALGQTIGANIGSVEVSIPRKDGTNQNLAIQIFDLVGDYCFSSVQKIFYLGACGAMVLYDITRKETFESIPFWINQYLTNSNRITPIMIMGNKIDLQNNAQVKTTEGKALADKLTNEIGTEVQFIETSALKGDNIQEAFQSLTQNMISFFQKHV